MSTLRVNALTDLAGVPYGFSQFVTGTTLLFYQAASPVGWTQLTTHNDKALRVVSGTGGSSGGTTAFTSVFTTQSVPLSQHSHSGTTGGQSADHTHNFPFYQGNSNGAGVGGGNALPQYLKTDPITTSGTSNNHTHDFVTSAEGTPNASMDFAVQYIDVILCSKN